MTNTMKIGLTVAGVAVAVGVGYMIYKKMQKPVTVSADGGCGCGCNGKKMNAAGPTSSSYTGGSVAGKVRTGSGGTVKGKYRCYDDVTKTWFESESPCTSYNTK